MSQSATRGTRYELLYMDLKERIRQGLHQVGDRLPSVKSMMTHNGVSQSTVVKALEMLESEGLVERQPRAGIFVARREPPSPRPLKVWLDASADELRRGLKESGDAFAQCQIKVHQPPRFASTEETPDVLTIYAMGVRAAVDQGQLVPLDPFLRQDPQVAERLLPDALDIYRHDGRVWALPIYWSPLATHVNLDAFERLGVPPPGNEWTFEDLVATCRALAQKGATRPLAWMDQFHHQASLLFALGARLYDADQQRLLLDAPQMAGAFEDLRRLAAVAGAPVRNSSDATAAFAAGQCPLLFWGMIRHPETLNFRHKAVPMPGRQNTVVASSAMAISSRCADPERAWRFVRAMFSPEAAQWTARNGWQFPPTHAGMLGVLRKHPDLLPLCQRLESVRTEIYQLGDSRARVIREMLEGWIRPETDIAERLRLAQKAIEAMSWTSADPWEAGCSPAVRSAAPHERNRE
ncbi:MAG TPA: extracellular solute-binding protein [Candidatus Brocadiia bacterium]|nr:extracellular solute-binding protein [Candidatus Brocadiia bacterium]